jgi:hypothetical protein
VISFQDAQRVGVGLKSCDVSIDDQVMVAEAIVAMCEHWVASSRSLAMKGELGAADWAAFELEIWTLGETLRLFLKRKKQWRGPGALMDAVARILRRKDFGKGRQTFALLLGDFGGITYSTELGAAIGDPEIAGHSIKALTKLRVPGHEPAVQAVIQRETGWVRSAARKYLAAVAKDE